MVAFQKSVRIVHLQKNVLTVHGKNVVVGMQLILENTSNMYYTNNLKLICGVDLLVQYSQYSNYAVGEFC